jgi:thiamine biosynthesis lipoprotein
VDRRRLTAPSPGLLLALLALLAAGCGPGREHRMTGRTMGTTYHVTVVTTWHGSSAGLQEKIDRRLEEINQHFSTYREDSELNRFNRFPRVGEEFPISQDFLRVMKTAAEVFALSGGAWDGTVKPLVDLWGFGRAGPVDQAPPPDRIASLLADVGFQKIEIRDAGALVKRQASVTLDLSSIAKGYGVDEVAEVIRKEGFSSFIVEIGGEVYAAGVRPDGRPWRVGINRPRVEAAPDEIYRIVSLQDGAFATSGDYRVYFVEKGVRYSHIIDPKTGYPVTNRVVSVSIQAPNCTLADGLATAVMVMGAEAGIALVDRLDGVEGLVVVEAPDGRLQDHPSKGFRSEPPAG